MKYSIKDSLLALLHSILPAHLVYISKSKLSIIWLCVQLCSCDFHSQIKALRRISLSHRHVTRGGTDTFCWWQALTLSAVSKPAKIFVSPWAYSSCCCCLSLSFRNDRDTFPLNSTCADIGLTFLSPTVIEEKVASVSSADRWIDQFELHLQRDITMFLGRSQVNWGIGIRR